MKIIQDIIVTEDITLISLHDTPSDINIISKIFELISEAQIDVDMISQTPPTGNNTNLSFTVNSEDFAKVLIIAGKFRELDSNIKINVSSDNCKISVFGEGMKGQPGVVSKVLSALSTTKTDIRMITTSEVDISILVVKSDCDNAVKAITEVFN